MLVTSQLGTDPKRQAPIASSGVYLGRWGADKGFSTAQRPHPPPPAPTSNSTGVQRPRLKMVWDVFQVPETVSSQVGL